MRSCRKAQTRARFSGAEREALRIPAGTEFAPDFDRELSMTRSLIDDFPAQGLMRQFLSSFRRSSDVRTADSLIQPIEYSYTVESLQEMAHRCGLELWAPCPNMLARGATTWNLQFSQPEIQELYDKLPDLRRWQVTNVLLCENLPILCI